MHIAFLIRCLSPGGAERAATALANQMTRCGHKVTILCLTGTDCFYETDPEINIRYLNSDPAELTAGIRRLTDLLQRSRTIRKAVREIGPDVLVGMSWMMSVYAVFSTCGTPVASIGTERSNPFILNKSRVNSFLRQFAAKHCDGFVCQTEKARSFFSSAAQRKIRIIPNGIFNPEVFNTPVPYEREKIITALGRLDDNKGYDVLIRAFALVRARRPDYTLCIFGDGEKRDDLLSLAASLGVADAVRLPGTDKSAIRKIAASSVFVLSPRSEGMPNALIEAMAVGVPCVSTRCDMGPEELIRDGVNGLLVPVDDPDSMAKAILRVLDDPQLQTDLSHAAVAIRSTHAVEPVTDRWLRLFDEVRSAKCGKARNYKK